MSYSTHRRRRIISSAMGAQALPTAPVITSAEAIAIEMPPLGYLPYSVTLEWDDLSTNESGFQVEYLLNGDEFGPMCHPGAFPCNPLQRYAANVTSGGGPLTTTVKTDGDAVQVRVCAFNDTGSNCSEPVTVLLPVPPP